MGEKIASRQASHDEHSKNPAAALFANQRNREDIAPTVRAIETGTYDFKYPTALFETPRKSMATHEAYEIWEQTKPERYAMAGALIQEIYRSYAPRRALHLDPATRDPEPKTLDVLKMLSHELFSDAIDTWFGEVRRTEHHPRAALLRRFDTMIRFSEAHGLMAENNPKLFLMRGVGTATNIIWATIGTVPTMATQQHLDMTKEQALHAIRGAYAKVISPLSHMNLTMAVPIIHTLMGQHTPEFNPAYFRLMKKDSGYAFLLNHDKILEITVSKNRPVTELEPFGKTVWCPANASMDEGSENVIQGLFDWSVQMADRDLVRLNNLPKAVAV